MTGVRIDKNGVVGDVILSRSGVGGVEVVELGASEAINIGAGLLQPTQNVVEGAVLHDQNDDGLNGSINLVLLFFERKGE